MQPGESGPRAAEHRIVREVLVAQLADVLRLHVAEIALQLEAAPRHVDRRERGVALGGDIPVVGDAEFEAPLARLRVIGREQPAAPPALERKAGARKGEQRVIEEAQPWVVGSPLVGLVVEVELTRLEEPVILAGLASSEARGEQAILALAGKLDALGAAARRPLALQLKLRMLEGARAVEQVVVDRRAEEPVGAALQAYAALALDLAKLPVVAQELAKDADVALPDLGRAACAHLEVAHALDLLRIDRGGIRLGQRARWGS